MMWTVGITGLSGSGKSSLAQYYKHCGYATEDGDMLSRVVCRPQSPCLSALCEVFGNDIVDENGVLQRRSLGEKVYKNAEMNRRLIDIVHPYILEELKKRERCEEKNGGRFLFLDGAMIVGSIFEQHCHRLILVEASPRNSLNRIVLRDEISEQVAGNRLAAQKNIEEMRCAANYILHNDGPLDKLHEQAEEILQKLQCAQAQAET